MNCADCGRPVGRDGGPPDGWQLDDGCTVCVACCSADLAKVADVAAEVLAEMKPKLH